MWRYRGEKFTLEGNREDGKKLNEEAPRHPHPWKQSQISDSKFSSSHLVPHLHPAFHFHTTESHFIRLGRWERPLIPGAAETNWEIRRSPSFRPRSHQHNRTTESRQNKQTEVTTKNRPTGRFGGHLPSDEDPTRIPPLTTKQPKWARGLKQTKQINSKIPTGRSQQNNSTTESHKKTKKE